MSKILLLCLFISFHAYGEDHRGFETRKAWVQLLREFSLEMEKSNENSIQTTEQKSYFQKLKLLEEAWADSAYDCLYAGWPSVLKSFGGRKLCTNPKTANASYGQSSCKQNQLQCQPLLFGKNLCVSFVTKQEKQTSFSRCEKKFKAEKRSDDFLKSPDFTRENAEALRELSALAATICDPDGSAPQRKTPMCKLIMTRLPAALSSIDEGWKEATIKEQEEKKKTEEKTKQEKTVVKPKTDDLSCLTDKSNDKVIEEIQVISETVSYDSVSLYDDIKKDFEESAFCDPAKIVSDPSERGSGFLAKAAVKSLQFFSTWEQNPAKRTTMAQFKGIASGFDLSPNTVSEVETLIGKMNAMSTYSEAFREYGYRARGLILKEILERSQKDPDYQKDRIKDELVGSNIFSEDDLGNIHCPFVSRDAFMKAITGQEEILKKMPGSVKNKNLLTIVDYTRPSNERRMFVIDMKTKKVLHNTWVAHGLGGGSGPGVDNLGSLTPDQMSNEKGSNKSSDGFIIAQNKSYGTLYGDNVLLKGIDQNNTNLAARAVVLHGWQSPLAGYQAGLPKYSEDGDTPGTSDGVMKLLKMDVNTASAKEVERAYSDVSGVVSLPPFMAPTEGCLGVPLMNVKHLDAKKRNQTQLELLREDLPGSIIFNYSGENMKSKYF